MNVGAVFRFLAATTGAITMAFAVPIAWSLAAGDPGLLPLLRSSAVGVLTSGALFLCGRRASFLDMDVREAILAVTGSWLIVSVISGLPYMFSGALPNALDAIFEGVSGFTTTGATVIGRLSEIPRSILLWRSFSQWLGGVGIVVLALALFPVSGAGMELYKAEVSGPIHERLTPRIQQTAAFLWKTYLILTCAEIALLLAGGLDLFDSAALSFSTLATGGFSPYANSLGHFRSDYVRLVSGVFLFLSGANLTFYHSLIVRGNLSPLRENPELRCYAFLLFASGLLISLLLYAGGDFPSMRASLSAGFFHAVSMLSSCGFFTSDYSAWPASVRYLTLALMFCGGCAISTAGGLTCVRVLVIFKHIRTEFVRLLHPRAIVPTRMGNETLDASVVSACFAYLAAYVAIFGAGFVLLSLFGQDMAAALFGAAAALGNVGPGFGMAAPAENYAMLPGTVKAVLIFLMLCGRLEIFTLLAVFTPSFWRR
ncbi:MAG: TrkH family potassium uptake protein [Synergistaceae bacterium]|nr:TrkH family potassium uptake protein [Synergistaceae bacterium]